MDLKSIYNGLAECYEINKNIVLANKYNKLINYIDGEIYNKINEDQINKKEIEFQLTQIHFNDSITQAVKITNQQTQLKRGETVKYFLIIIVFIIGIFLAIIYKRFKISQLQKKEISQQKHLIEEKQKEIVDSINYAKRIQNTLLASEEVLNQNLKNHFVLFKPKDIVSGDFYWANSVTTQDSNLFFLAVCDSTGHGVPGAFMSLLNTNFLNEAINEKQIYEPNNVLDYVRNRLINSISKESQKDGFDGILICIDKSKNIITYAAANNSPILISPENGLTKLPCDKMPVGKGERNETFTNQTLNYKSGDTLYLYTDGFADQFGGPKGKKFKSQALNQLLLSIISQNPKQQSSTLNQHLMDWKGENEQVDDVCIVGVQL